MRRTRAPRQARPCPPRELQCAAPFRRTGGLGRARGDIDWKRPWLRTVDVCVNVSPLSATTPIRWGGGRRCSLGVKGGTSQPSPSYSERYSRSLDEGWTPVRLGTNDGPPDCSARSWRTSHPRAEKDRPGRRQTAPESHTSGQKNPGLTICGRRPGRDLVRLWFELPASVGERLARARRRGPSRAYPRTGGRRHPVPVMLVSTDTLRVFPPTRSAAPARLTVTATPSGYPGGLPCEPRTCGAPFAAR
jgi:hypothetical protein